MLEATAATISLATAGAVTKRIMDWTIGLLKQLQITVYCYRCLIISLEEVTEGVIDGTGACCKQLTINLMVYTLTCRLTNS